MKIDTSRLELPEIIFLKHILAQFPHKNQLTSLFLAIQMAFEIEKDTSAQLLTFPIDPDLVHGMAICNLMLLESYDYKNTPEDLFGFILRGFMASLVNCYQEKMFECDNGDFFLGKFTIPDSFIEHAKKALV